MNIAFFTDTYLPDKNGVATSVSQLKTELQALEHNIFIYTVKQPGLILQNEPGVTRWPSVSVTRKVAEARIAFTNPATITRHLLKNKIDIVHTHSEFSLGLTGRFISKMLNIPHVHTVHTMWDDYTHYILNGKLLTSKKVATLFRAFMKNCTAVVAPSNKAFLYLKKIGIAAYRINNGLSIEQFISRCHVAKQQEIRHKYGLNPEDFVVIFVGRLSNEKRIMDLHQTLTRAMQQQKNIKVLVLGQGDKRPLLQQEIQRLHQEGRFILTGPIPFEEMANFYTISQAFCTVSTSEVQPMTVLEAMAIGLPIVVRQDHAYDDLVLHNINGYIGETDEAVSQYVVNLAQNKALALRIGHESQQISKQFTSQIQAKNMAQLYEDVIRMGRPHFGFHPKVLEKQNA